MNTLPIFLGLATGVHASCYGAYKDSPYESFLVRRVVRELGIAISIGIVFSLLGLGLSEPYFVLFLVIFASSRIVTEIYKLFFRVEDQSLYLIPTQIHFFRKVVRSKVVRAFLGGACVLGLYGLFILTDSLLISAPLKGLITGSLIGLATALGGAYKDGLFEGFEWTKFFRSPLLGALGGLLLSAHTSQTAFILLGAIGVERMVVELYKGFLQKGYCPGKFKSKEPRCSAWLEKRKGFVAPYLATWVVFVALVWAQVG